MTISFQRNGDEGTVDARAIIKREGNGIGMKVFAKDSDSRTILAQLGRNEIGSPVIHYMFAVEPKSPEAALNGSYKGAAILEFDEYTGELSGHYWTSAFSKGRYTLFREDKDPKQDVDFSAVDVLLVTALKEEYDAAKEVFQTNEGAAGVGEWDDVLTYPAAPYIIGTFVLNERRLFTIAIARPTSMGGISTGPLAALLAERLKPKCLVMCGVCAGNPSEVGLGDVVVSKIVYQYDEGKKEGAEFRPDHRQAAVSKAWLHAAGELKAHRLPSYGRLEKIRQRHWLLRQLHQGDDPARHPARARYFPKGEWRDVVTELMDGKLVELEGERMRLTAMGAAEVHHSLLLDVDSPEKLPFEIVTGAIASGNAVVKDDKVWDWLSEMGQRKVVGMEMEAAAIAEAATLAGLDWIVVKGVMDHAGSKKDDRYKPFAARASAETLRLFLMGRFEAAQQPIAV
jgi:nucleoside phosphorylase